MTAVPDYVRDFSRKKFQQQERAGQNFEYVAIGEFDYRIDADLWTSCSLAVNPITKKEEVKAVYKRTPLLAVTGIVDTVRPSIDSVDALLGKSGLHDSEKHNSNSEKAIASKSAATAQNVTSLRVLDLGTGDGKTLHMLHHEKGIPWSNLLGITAEDMRGKKVLHDAETFDPRCPDESYLVANIEDLPASVTSGSKFDLIISWVTFIWLTDSIGTMCRMYKELLSPGGTMVIGGIQLVVDRFVDGEDDADGSSNANDTDDHQIWLFAWALYLRKVHGFNIRFLVDAWSGAYAWCFIQKAVVDGPGNPQLLTLEPALAYGVVDEGSSKVSYKVRRDVLSPYYDVVKAECEGDPSNLPSTRRRVAEVDESLYKNPDWFELKPGLRKMLKQYPLVEHLSANNLSEA